MAEESLTSYIVPVALVLWVGHSIAKRLGEHLRPCSHGSPGAYNDFSRCNACVAERVARENEARAAAERTRLEEDARRQAQKKRYSQLKRQFVEDARTLTFLQTLDPYVFQRLIWRVFQQLGFEVEETPAGRDGGVDGILHHDGNRYILQCKRYRGDVGEPVVRDLFGTMHHLGAQSGILITTGRISTHAIAFAKGKPLSLVDGKALAELVRTANLTEEMVPDDFVAPRGLPEVLDPRAGRTPTCPDCGARLKVRNGKFGEFWACTGPRCRFTMSAK